jgi:hypothetical protein
MRTVGYTALGAAVLFAFGAAVTTSAEAKKCVVAGGHGTGVTPDLARTMATAALGQSIATYRLKGAGKVSFRCDGNVILATCTARQRACR